MLASPKEAAATETDWTLLFFSFCLDFNLLYFQIKEASICSCSSKTGPTGQQGQWGMEYKEMVYKRGRKCLIVHFVENAKNELRVLRLHRNESERCEG